MPQHDPSITVGDVLVEVQSNLYESGLRRHTSVNILDSIEDGYRKCVAELTPISRSACIPKKGSPYYNFEEILPRYMYLVGIFNMTTNSWLEPLPNIAYKRDRLNFFTVGEPAFYHVVDMRRVHIWPYPSSASGALFVIYKAYPPSINTSYVPVLPHSTGSQFLEYFATAESFEKDREFSKAQVWWNRIYKPIGSQSSLYNQLDREISSLARYDFDAVLEPYRWIFHGGGSSVAWISDETPSGTVDGVNDTFQLEGTPNPTNSLILTINGQCMYQDEAYILSGQSITMQSGYVPESGDMLRAWYQV